MCAAGGSRTVTQSFEMRKLLTCFLLLLCPACARAAEAKGFVRPEDCSQFTGSHLELQQIDGQKLRKSIVLKIPWVSYFESSLNQWFAITSTGCANDRCEAIKAAKIRVAHVSYGMFVPFRGRNINGFSGDVSIEFSDGHKFEGPFIARTRKAVHRIICD
jgi:hypothetical protein